MNDHQEIDGMIKSLLGGRDTRAATEHGHALAERRLDQAIAGRAPRMRRRKVARPPLAVAVACGLVLVSGVAVAATTDLADRILGSKEPAADRIGVIRDDSRPVMTQAELIEEWRGAAVKEQIGERVQGQLGRILVQDDRARISARRTAEGDVCMALEGHASLKPPEPAEWRPASGGCGTFADGWPLMDAIGANGFAGSLSYGLVADGVVKVRFIVDGETLDAKMGEGAFLWRNPRDAKPSDIEAVLEDGTVVRRDLTWAWEGYGPPSKPQVVS